MHIIYSDRYPYFSAGFPWFAITALTWCSTSPRRPDLSVSGTFAAGPFDFCVIKSGMSGNPICSKGSCTCFIRLHSEGLQPSQTDGSFLRALSVVEGDDVPFGVTDSPYVLKLSEMLTLQFVITLLLYVKCVKYEMLLNTAVSLFVCHAHSKSSIKITAVPPVLTVCYNHTLGHAWPTVTAGVDSVCCLQMRRTQKQMIHVPNTPKMNRSHLITEAAANFGINGNSLIR